MHFCQADWIQGKIINILLALVIHCCFSLLFCFLVVPYFEIELKYWHMCLCFCVCLFKMLRHGTLVIISTSSLYLFREVFSSSL